MGRFIRCTDEKTRNELIKMGFKLMGEECNGSKKTYIFNNMKDSSKYVNTNINVMASNRLYF